MKNFIIYNNDNSRGSVIIAYDFLGSMFRVTEVCTKTRRVKYFEYLSDAITFAALLCKSNGIDFEQRNTNTITVCYWRNEYGDAPIKITYEPNTSHLAISYEIDGDIQTCRYTTALNIYNIAKSYCEDFDIDFWNVKY